MLKRLIYPYVGCPTINHVNFQFLKEGLGIKYLILDKDDTLTIHDSDKLHSSIEPRKIREIIDLYKDRVFLVSNNKNPFDVDFTPALNDLVKKENSFRIIKTKKKKPFNFPEVKQNLEELFKGESVKGEEIAIIGDRILTDMYLAKKGSCFSIYVADFPESHKERPILLNTMRFIEHILFFQQKYGRTIRKHTFNGIPFFHDDVFDTNAKD